MIDESYVPIILRPGWVLERYYNWSVVEQGPTLKLLKKARGPIRTFLLLVCRASDEGMAEAARRHGLLGRRSIVVLNDFSSESDEGVRVVAGVPFRRVTTRRWLGIGTFVIDLSEDLRTLWSRIATRERTKCRSVERHGVKVEFEERPSAEAVDAFLALYRPMTRRRGLERPRRVTLQQMSAAGDLLMARCVDLSGRNLVINLIYLCDGQGYYLHGARAPEIPAGAGHFTQWETIKCLKTAGLRWYDLGLVASRDGSDGIYRFKASLGGMFVDFGREFEFVSGGLRTVYRMFRAVRSALRSTW